MLAPTFSNFVLDQPFVFDHNAVLMRQNKNATKNKAKI
jgi:hypothetical protein